MVGGMALLTRRHRRARLLLPFAAICVGLFLAFRPVTAHDSEAVILIMPPAFGFLLWRGWPEVRRISRWKYVMYLVVMSAIIAGAQAFAAFMAGGRLLWLEVGWGLYFCVAWRMAWAVWQRTVGRLGAGLCRWRRQRRFQANGWAKMGSARRMWLAVAAGAIPTLRIGLVLCVFAPLFVGSLIHRFRIGNPTELDYYAHLPIEPVSFRTSDGLRLSGWFLPDGQSDETVIVAHGLGANKGNFIAFLTLFYGQGYNSLIFDFRGHGDSQGHTSTFGLYETADVIAALEWLKQERPERARHVFGLGSSMGAMALVRAAARDERIEAVVLDSAYVSAPRLARHHLGPALAPLVLGAMSLHAGRSLWSLDASQAIAELSPRPILLIHGEGDFVIPPDNMAILFDLAHEPKEQWLGPGSHSNILTSDFNGYQQRVIQFLDQARRRRSGS